MGCRFWVELRGRVWIECADLVAIPMVATVSESGNEQEGKAHLGRG
jgi:hypothetical protein